MKLSLESTNRIRALSNFSTTDCGEFRITLLELRNSIENTPFPLNEQEWLLNLLSLDDNSCMQLHMIMDILREATS